MVGYTPCTCMPINPDSAAMVEIKEKSTTTTGIERATA
jgi:hypothetical protein